MYHLMTALFVPFKQLNSWHVKALVAIQALIALGIWFTVGGLIPTPIEVVHALGKMVDKGLLQELWTSSKTLLISLALATTISTGIAAISTAWIFKPFGNAASGMRFLGFAGLTFIFLLITDGAFELKVMLLTFGITVFMTTSLLAEVRSITQDELDYASTLKLTGWKAVLELFIVGKFDKVLDLMRQNAAVGWTILAMVEGITRSEGGIGAMLLVENKYLNLSTVFAIQLVILVYGIIQDQVLGAVRLWLCPHLQPTHA
jgi:ABC-type nitrate/sulfonate/bicarbonate transport system permease component